MAKRMEIDFAKKVAVTARARSKEAARNKLIRHNERKN